jgi:hypothetical protein
VAPLAAATPATAITARGDRVYWNEGASIRTSSVELAKAEPLVTTDGDVRDIEVASDSIYTIRKPAEVKVERIVPLLR